MALRMRVADGEWRTYSGGIVDIFEPAEASQVASVEEQRIAVHRFFGLPVTGGWDWSSVSTATGKAAELLPLLDDLLEGDEPQRDRAFGSIYGGVVNQGDLYAAAAPVVDRILATLKTQGSLPEYAWLILHEIFRGASYGRRVCAPDGEYDIEVYCRRKILGEVDLIGRSIAGLAGNTFFYCMLLFGGMGEYSPEVRAILEQEVSTSTGERRQVASDALEVAVELAAERASGVRGPSDDQR
ncbi:hypothetical protein AB0K18_42110 [Nonomuraea sp. NPDC049421]|uniref:hypothetical protein n=1 Tax=Nonomuraea sp. NPDC049421 TaxID=3155275 RepID=UPI003438F89F